MHQCFGYVAVIVRNGGQRSQRFRPEAFQRAFAGLAMQTPVGDFVQPLPHLPVHIVQIGELAQGPEVLAKVADGAFDLAFFPTAGSIAGMGKEAMIAGKAEEAREKTDQTAIVFDNGGGQVIVCDFARHPTQNVKRVSMTTGEGRKALTVRELDVEHPAVSIDQREGIEFARIAGVTESAEMTPVHFEALSGRRLHSGRMRVWAAWAVHRARIRGLCCGLPDIPGSEASVR